MRWAILHLHTDGRYDYMINSLVNLQKFNLKSFLASFSVSNVKICCFLKKKDKLGFVRKIKRFLKLYIVYYSLKLNRLNEWLIM